MNLNLNRKTFLAWHNAINVVNTCGWVGALIALQFTEALQLYLAVIHLFAMCFMAIATDTIWYSVHQECRDKFRYGLPSDADDLITKINWFNLHGLTITAVFAGGVYCCHPSLIQLYIAVSLFISFMIQLFYKRTVNHYYDTCEAMLKEQESLLWINTH